MEERQIFLTDSGQGTDLVGDLTARGRILGDWRRQYERMRRSYQRLLGYAEGRTPSEDAAEAEDALLHFFQDAYHLKDWIRQNEPGHSKSVESQFKKPAGPLPMLLCADLCNGSKHFVLTRSARLGGEFVSHSVTVRPPTAGSSLPPEPALHRWTVRWSDGECDALELAAECVAAWNKWLGERSLDPSA